VGWDWTAIQLDDGRELMFYRLRRADGSSSRFSKGSLVEADGSTRRLTVDDLTVEVRETWASPRDGTRYPSRWRLAVPSAGLDLDVVPRLADQELDLTVRYWEGAVVVDGHARDRPVRGVGYVELVGYADPNRRR
jgi:predicted secreted hydrolase